MDSALTTFSRLWNGPEPYLSTSTSGTTRGGKEISLSKADMELSARATLEHLGLGSDNMTFLSAINPEYIGGKMMMLRAMLAGARMVQLKPSLDPLEGLPEDVTAVDLMAIVPAQVDKLLEASCPPEIRNIIIGGAPLSIDQERRLTERLPRAKMFSTYGMTETCSHVALRPLGEPYYTAMPGVTFSTDDHSCLVINHPEATWSPLVTRDVVKLLSATVMQWQGRADNVINTGGIKVHPEELEAKIATSLKLPPFYITSKPHPQWGEALTLVVERDCERDLSGLLARLRGILPARMVPKQVVEVEKFQRTPTGKIIRTC